MKKTAFTLAEVLITLAIIGVVAAVSIPSVISNSNQQQYRTGLKKAISVLNSAITMNMALEGETPYDNANLMGYLMRHMSVMKSTTDITKYFVALAPQNNTQFNNATFYTTDGMRFEFRWGGLTINNFPLYENPTVYACHSNVLTIGSNRCGGCGSYGLPNNVDGTTKPPCMHTFRHPALGHCHQGIHNLIQTILDLSSENGLHHKVQLCFDLDLEICLVRV